MQRNGTSSRGRLPRRPRLVLAIGLMSLAACAPVGPDYAPPTFALPEAWKEATTAEGDLAASWWRQLEDPVLDELVDAVLTRNLDLEQALSRIAETRAARGIVETDLRPRVDATGQASRSQSSTEVAGGQFIPRTAKRFALGLEASWEIDLSGRVRRQVEAASAEIEVSVEDARGLVVMLVADVATAYVSLREFEERQRIAEANAQTQERTLDLGRSRFEAGLVSELDVRQAEVSLASTRAAIPPLRAGARTALHRLAVLAGRSPGHLVGSLPAGNGLPQAPQEIAVGLPVEMLARRPDLRAAERALAAQTARIGIAEGALYPRLDLLGSVGVEGQEPGALVDSGGTTFSFGPAISWNLFDRTAVNAAVVVEEERTHQLLLAYEARLLVALEEVENALVSLREDRATVAALEEAVSRSRRALELSREQYRQGLVDIQRVLDAQTRQFELEDRLVQARASTTLRAIQLFAALGGGWAERDLILVPAEEEEQS